MFHRSRDVAGGSDIAASLSTHGSEGLADEVAKLDTTAMALGDQIEELVHTLATVDRSPAITKRLREPETELEELQEAIRGKRALLGTRSPVAWLRDLKGRETAARSHRSILPCVSYSPRQPSTTKPGSSSCERTAGPQFCYV